MITIEQIKTEFSYINALLGSSEFYHDTVIFEGHGEFCDIYIKCSKKEITQEQVDIYNTFKLNYKSFLDEIERFVSFNLEPNEKSKYEEIRNATLTFDVIEIPIQNDKYDLVLVCGKTYKYFTFFKKNINLRVEFNNDKINSIRRKKDTTQDN